MLHVNGGEGTVCRVLPNAAHQRVLSRRTSVVSPKLSRSDLVQSLFIGNWHYPMFCTIHSLLQKVRKTLFLNRVRGVSQKT